MAQLRAKQIKLSNPGDLLVGGANGNGTVLSQGTPGQVLKVLAGGAIAYEKAKAADTTFSDATFTATDTQAALVEAKKTATDEVARATAAETAIQSELDATQAGAGLTAAGAYTADSTTTYIKDATTLAGADKKLDTAIKAVKDQLDALGSGSINALQAEVDALEASVGTNADGTYKASTNDVIKAATSVLNADELLAAAITKEIADRGTAVTAENTRAMAAEKVNSDAIAAEVTRATGAETVLQGNIDAEVTRAKAAEKTNADAIAAETTRATGAETGLDTRLTKAETDLLAVEGELNTLETTVGSKADGSAVDFTNVAYIAATDSHYTAINKLDAGVKTVADAVAAEVTRATGAETALQTELNTTQAGAGLGADGTYAAETAYDASTAPNGAHYVQTATSLKSADKILDAALFALKTQVDELGTGSITDLQAEVDRIEATIGLTATGALIDYTSKNYIATNDTFKSAIEKLDGALHGVDAAYKAADDNLQQQINSLVGLDALVFKGNFAGDITAAALNATVADNGDVYRISSNPTQNFAGLGYDVNVGDFVAKTADGWVKFDNTDPTLTTTDANLTVGGNTFTGYTIALNKKSLTSASTALVVTGGANATLSDVSVNLDPSKITFETLGNVGTPVANQFLRWNGTAIEYVSAGALGVVTHAEEDFTPSTAANAAITLAHTPATGHALAVYINGVKLKNAGFAVSGSTVTLNDQNNGYGIETGDTVSVSYNYSA